MATGHPDFKHPRCYANSRGGCSDGISGEHYVSFGLIKLYHGDRPMVTPGPEYGIPRAIPGKIFTANVLCGAHNSGLSSADAAAIDFARPLRAAAVEFVTTGVWGTAEVHEVSGSDFRRWVLKLLMTHAAADVLRRDGETISTPEHPAAVDLLLDRAAWPHTWGLAVGPAKGNKYLTSHPFRAKALNEWWGATPFIDRNGKLCGGIVELAGVSFALTLFNQGRAEGYTADPESPFYRSVPHPSFVAWDLNGVEKRVNFTWDDLHAHGGITYGFESRPVAS